MWFRRAPHQKAQEEGQLCGLAIFPHSALQFDFGRAKIWFCASGEKQERGGEHIGRLPPN